VEEKYKVALNEYGLSDNEIEVYITLLKLGESSVQNIAKNTNLPRTTTYHLLESLNKQGLVGFSIKESIKYFSATNPQKLKYFLEEKKKHIEDILPELKSLYGTLKEKPKTEIFEGIKGIRSVLKDILEEKKEILHYGEVVSLNDNLKYIFPSYISERVKKKIPIRIIGKKEKEHLPLIKKAKKEYRKFRFLPGNNNFKTGIWIYNKKVAIINTLSQPHYAIIVENKDFYDTQKQVFELLWKSAKP
jgi:HTH-type transcriptional regulator, sugar sensing transcriptional regulator